MSKLQTELIVGLDELHAQSNEWNRLWFESDTHVVLHRAETLSHWVESFGQAHDFRAIVVRDHDRWVSAMPMLLQRNRFGRVEGLAIGNEWAIPDCFLDIPHADPGRFQAIQSGLIQLGIFLFKSNWCPLGWPSSQRLIAGWQQQQRAWVRPRFRVDQLNLPLEWDTYWHQLSKNRRKKLQKAEQELLERASTGTVELDCFRGTCIETANRYLEQALLIENSSWKGANGSSILSQAKVANFFRRNIEALAVQGLLRIYLLKVGETPIAFDLGSLVRRVYTSYKVSFLPQFAQQSPGHLLTAKLIRQLIEQEQAIAIDFLGGSSEATARWANDSYLSGRLVLSSGTWLSDLSLLAVGNLINFARPSTVS